MTAGNSIIRVFVIDPSPGDRALLRDILRTDPHMEPAGEASPAEILAGNTIPPPPDVFLLAATAPKEAARIARHIMEDSARPILGLTRLKTDLGFDSQNPLVDAGALMVMGKPYGLPGDDPLADQLLAQIRAVAGVKLVRRRGHAPQKGSPAGTRQKKKQACLGIVAIGASTGGPPALRALLSGLTPDFPAPIVVVQHISHGFVEGLAKWLDETTPLSVTVPAKSQVMVPGVVYLAPDGRHATVTKTGRLVLKNAEPMDGHRPSATVLFESVAKAYGPEAAGVLLTGMGKDGAAGLKTLALAGASTFCQDRESSVVFGMNKEAIALGAAMQVLPPERIGQALKRLAAKSGGRNCK